MRQFIKNYREDLANRHKKPKYITGLGVNLFWVFLAVSLGVLLMVISEIVFGDKDMTFLEIVDNGTWVLILYSFGIATASIIMLLKYGNKTTVDKSFNDLNEKFDILTELITKDREQTRSELKKGNDLIHQDMDNLIKSIEQLAEEIRNDRNERNKKSD